MAKISRFDGSLVELSNTIKQHDGPSIIIFDAMWCPGCRRLVRILPNYACENTKAQYLIIDIDDNPTIKTYFAIDSLPSIKFCKQTPNLDVIETLIGLNLPLLKEKLVAYA